MGNWIAENWIALVALVVSIGLAVIKLTEWWQARHRIHIACRSVTVGIPSKDGKEISNRSYVAITVTTEGRPIAVSRIDFSLVGESPDSSQDPQMGSADELTRLPTAGFPPTGFDNPVNLADGSGQTWTTELSVPPFDYTAIRGYMFRAEVHLANGKLLKSEPFWHVPSPPNGWSEKDLNTKPFGK